MPPSPIFWSSLYRPTTVPGPSVNGAAAMPGKWSSAPKKSWAPSASHSRGLDATAQVGVGATGLGQIGGAFGGVAQLPRVQKDVIQRGHSSYMRQRQGKTDSLKAPNSKRQAPEKFQGPKLQQSVRDGCQKRSRAASG